jgi:hypothetical protein
MSEKTQSAHGNGAAILLLVLQACGVAGCAFLAIMLAFVSDACSGDKTCNLNLIGTGMAVTGLTPIAFWIVSLVHTIVRGRRDESSWWVPLLWSVVTAGVALTGVLVAFHGAPDGF